jgi:hypothetical protein
MLRIFVPVRVKSYLINQYVSKECDCPIFFTGPPRIVLEKLRCSILIVNYLLGASSLCNFGGFLKLSIKGSLVSIIER